ncbi:hypothetical protein RHGRI_012742 [Rhododendron griersonianum]|uniref:Uncharacterized protein n=1 Tax=Rhododendron griersonianum TaxID=479676 RepID=A0AAV6KSR6_9ERIC|nr:hypothetical protein RHGRI_012742 [Rhododendron griersonianum]
MEGHYQGVLLSISVTNLLSRDFAYHVMGHFELWFVSAGGCVVLHSMGGVHLKGHFVYLYCICKDIGSMSTAAIVVIFWVLFYCHVGDSNFDFE